VKSLHQGKLFCQVSLNFSLLIVVWNIWNNAVSAHLCNLSMTEFHLCKKLLLHMPAEPTEKVTCLILREEKDGGCKRIAEGIII